MKEIVISIMVCLLAATAAFFALKAYPQLALFLAAVICVAMVVIYIKDAIIRRHLGRLYCFLGIGAAAAFCYIGYNIFVPIYTFIQTEELPKHILDMGAWKISWLSLTTGIFVVFAGQNIRLYMLRKELKKLLKKGE